MSEAAAPPADPGALIRSRSYRVLLVFAALIGVLVSFASWCFLELVHWIQDRGVQGPAQWAGIGSGSLVVAAAGAGGGRGADGRRDRAPARSRRAHPLRGDRGRDRQAGRAAGHPARRAGHSRPRAGAGTGGPAHRARRRFGGAGRAAGEKGHAGPSHGGALSRRGVRRNRHDLRLAGHRRDHPDRGRRHWRADAATDPAARPDVCRDRLSHLHRHGQLDRAQLQRLRAEPVYAARVLRSDRRRIRLGHRARVRRRGGHLRHHRSRTQVGPCGRQAAVAAATGGRLGRRPALRSGLPRSPTSQRMLSCSPGRTPSAP